METLMKWFINAKVFSGLRSYLAKELKNALLNKNGVLVFYDTSLGVKSFDVIRQLKKDNRLFVRYPEAYQVCAMVDRVKEICGDIVEVGVYRGGTAKLICEIEKNKTVHLFDTFAGLPELHEKDAHKLFYKGAYTAEFEDTRDYLKDYKNIHFYKGLFSENAYLLKDKNFSLVHLDVDIYQSTLDCLNFFYYRMSKKGVILSHDYPVSKGVKLAFDEFFKDKPEMVIELPGCGQCMIIKI
ncbi:TylF/MycF family methyltransferase [Candidatus Parcubacteria bacterium]|nr:TylF/MycF family methyltransferase [Candidatus Parcubacteria bacterium]MCG2694421.1 TylF/MycF family methyltransferase [Candidatus Parcubacteria bacterium]